ncbi:hypothetical protein VNO80_09729 [Phaseolus coccineus]|uniref:Uncharacterized protein n=1 Tax=Phaseolus coccineus TaxID=3886 RepID=A0AAN9N7C7_PHACN
MQDQREGPRGAYVVKGRERGRSVWKGKRGTLNSGLWEEKVCSVDDSIGTYNSGKQQIPKRASKPFKKRPRHHMITLSVLVGQEGFEVSEMGSTLICGRNDERI